MTSLSASMSRLSRQSSESSFHIEDESSPYLNNALKSVDHVLSTQGKAIDYLVKQYRNSQWSQHQMKKSLRILNNSLNQGGKVVVSGMGKSFKIANKTVATFNSLSIHSAALHPTEALHGDLGIIREEHNDCLILISASGNSPELSTLLQYVPKSIPVVLVTCTKISNLSKHPKVNSLLYAELPSKLSEKNLYGLSAPTISTTLCLTLLDAVSIALSELHINDLKARQKRFGERHPGGAIGIDYLQGFSSKESNNMAVGGSSSGDFTYFSKSISDSSSATTTNENHSPEENKESSEYTEDEDGVLDLANLQLFQEVKLSESKISLDNLPNDEFKLIQLITMYDYLLVANLEVTQVLESKVAQDVYRKCKLQQDTWDDIKWKIADCLTKLMV